MKKLNKIGLACLLIVVAILFVLAFTVYATENVVTNSKGSTPSGGPTSSSMGANRQTLNVDSTPSYQITDIDNAADPQYFGYVTTNGSWYIMKYGVAANTYRYSNGTSGYAAAWTGRSSLTYDYLYNLTW